MFALFIILNEVDYLEEILEEFLNLGVRGATILDSQGMASALAGQDSHSIPMFGLLKTFMEMARPFNKTIITVLENQELVDRVVALVRDTLGKDAKEGAGFMFSLPLGGIYPL